MNKHVNLCLSIYLFIVSNITDMFNTRISKGDTNVSQCLNCVTLFEKSLELGSKIIPMQNMYAYK